MGNKKKLIRLTTADISLNSFLRGQLRFLNQYFDVVGVASDTGKLHAVGEREGIRVINVPMHREISLKADIVSLWTLYRLFRKERPDILHTNTPKGSLLAMAAAWAAHVPHRVYLVTGLRYKGAHGLLRIILKTMERITCFFATKVIPEGQGVVHMLRTDHITRKPLQVLHYGNINGIDTDVYSNIRLSADMNLLPLGNDETECKSHVSSVVRKELGLSQQDFVFVFVGRIVKDKGINELAHCMNRLDCKLILVGSFDKDDPIDEDALTFLQNSEKVKCVGWQEDVRPYLAAADAMVFPSYREGFPNTPIQAGAMGIPTIVTDINGSNEIIKDNLNGKIIIAPLDHPNGSALMEQTLYSTMEWFTSHPTEVVRMGKNTRELITSRYEQQQVWAAILEMYQSL